ncbi:MAG: RNase adapter RapZ [Lachnospiraceae bacterium]
MRFLIVTGMSGAGKSSVLDMLEDNGYFCVDNLPVPYLENFVQMSWQERNTVSKVAVVIDVRSRKNLAKLEGILGSLREKGYEYQILFLDCRDNVLIRRYKETRRNHPLAGEAVSIRSAISMERKALTYMRTHADYIIDTSTMLVRDLKMELNRVLSGNPYNNFYLTFIAFGYKYGIPSEADLVFDVRFLPNPFYVEGMRYRTGMDQDVFNYVMDNEDARTFLQKTGDLLEFLIPLYIREGKNGLVTAIGCTGGQHRSVAVTRALTEAFREKRISAKAEFRDVDKHV